MKDNSMEILKRKYEKRINDLESKLVFGLRLNTLSSSQIRFLWKKIEKEKKKLEELNLKGEV